MQIEIETMKPMNIILKLTFVAFIALSVTQPVSAQVTQAELETIDGLEHLRSTGELYSGKVVDTNRLSGTVEDGKRTGTWTWLYPSGQREYQTVYTEGLPVSSTGWYEDGTLEMAIQFKNGRIHGTRKNWGKDGDITRESKYSEGIPNGIHKIWDQNGHLLYSTTFVDGQIHGAATWWYSDGSPRWISSYANGTRSGQWIQYQVDGSVLVQSVWENDKLVERKDPHKNH
ncbi:MAG: toxin-antitoxin system YwqK family antitoxin [Rhodothermales bacterium]|nr:toxin-antitoxin system YwqK family antitoxin [Rhodothermales bacterium]